MDGKLCPGIQPPPPPHPEIVTPLFQEKPPPSNPKIFQPPPLFEILA